MIAATIANARPGIKKRYKPSDFFPGNMGPKKQQTMQDQMAFFTRMIGGDK